jgi:nitrogen fixation protein NifB
MIHATESRRHPSGEPRSKGCGTSGGSGKASCGSAAGQGDLSPEIWEKVKNHPCYSEEAHHHYARMHVAVAPACNIQCNYCNRKYDCANESRPGVVSEKLTPEQAAEGAGGRFDDSADDGARHRGSRRSAGQSREDLQDLRAVTKTAPDIKLCLSTNGLMLPDHVDTIASKFNVDHVTITINMVDPEMGAKIYPWIFYKHKRYTGVEARAGF